jgi:hypothetical protein
LAETSDISLLLEKRLGFALWEDEISYLFGRTVGELFAIARQRVRGETGHIPARHDKLAERMALPMNQLAGSRPR